MTGSASSARRGKKSESAFRTISEVASELNVQQHVLRFWEGRFAEIQPMKRGGGRRYYRPEDVALLRTIRDRLYDDGFTIKGVQRLLAEKGAETFIAEASLPAESMGLHVDATEPPLPFDLPQEACTPSVTSKSSRSSLTSHQKAEIKAAIRELEGLKMTLDQVLG